MTGTILIAIFIAIFSFFFVWKGLRIVRQSQVMVIERFGKYSRTLNSGINILIPIADKERAIKSRVEKRTFATDQQGASSVYVIRNKKTIDLRETVYDFPKQNVITKDNVNVEINALLYFQIMDPVKAIYEIENLPDAIEKLTQTTLRNVIGELELDETLVSRDTINLKLRTILDEATNKWGVKVNRVELQDINPPADIKEAMEKQMRAERDRRAAVLEAEGAKKSKILEAEGSKESDINIAEGQRRADILIAEGQAEARIKVAKAEAEAIRLISQAIETKESPVNYLIANKYIETLSAMVEGKDNKTVYVPYEASSVLSSLGGMKEIFNNKK